MPAALSHSQVAVGLLWRIFDKLAALLAVSAAWWLAAQHLDGWGWFLVAAAWLGASVHVDLGSRDQEEEEEEEPND